MARRTTCRTGKKLYAGESEALEALERLRGQRTAGKVPVRAYRCHLCRWWHITSQRKARP